MVGMICDKGNFRKTNQDYCGYYEDNDSGIYIIADGMGGHSGGEVASRIAVTETLQYIKHNISSDNLGETLKLAITKANSSILDKAEKNEELKGMGSTITACYIKNNGAVVANVGDSACFIKFEGQVKKVTKDHSLVQELVDLGNISEEEAKNHPNKNIITRALGTNREVEIDLFNIELENVQKLILCTDGLSNFVTPEDMLHALDTYDDEQCCRELVELSKRNGSKDNISIIVFKGEGQYDR